MSLLEQGKAIDKWHNSGCLVCEFIEDQKPALQAELDELLNTRNRKGEYAVGHTAAANVMAPLGYTGTRTVVMNHRNRGDRQPKAGQA